MKWIGQNIYDLISRFRDDVYLEDLTTTTETNVLVVDSNGLVSKSTTLADDLESDVEASIDTLANLTSFGAAGATTNIVAGDLTMYNAVNDGNPTISLGSSATNRFEIKTAYNSGAQTLDEVYFSSYTTSETTNDGRYIWEVDEVELARMLDTGLIVYGNITASDADAMITAQDTAASSATQGGKLRLQSNDGATMADDQRLGVIEFRGAEDSSSTLSTGARIQAICRDAWDGSNNDADLEFYTTDGTTESKVLTLDADKLATFTGAVTATGALTGTLATASQPNITTLAGVTAMGTAANTLVVTNDIVRFDSTNANDPLVLIKNSANDATSGRLRFLNERGADGQDNDETGIIEFFSYDDGTPNGERYARIIGTIHDASATEESGKLSLQVASHDGGDEDGLVLTGGSADAEVDVTIGNGTASVTTLAGTLTMGSTAAMTNAGLLSVANQSNITGLGTISSGVWNGTKITDVYTNSSGKRYGSTIKILPSDFMINEDAAAPLSFKDGSNSGVHINDTANEAIAFVTIPEGMTATLVDVYGTHAKTLKVWEVNVNASFDFTGTTKGTGAVNTQLDITDVDATATNFLAIQVTLTATTQRIWGGIVTIAAQ